MEQRPRHIVAQWLVTHWRRLAGDLVLVLAVLGGLIVVLSQFLRATLPSPMYYPAQVEVTLGAYDSIYIQVTRCYQEPLAYPEIVLRVDRRLVNADNGFSFPLVTGPAPAMQGCHTYNYYLQQLPDNVPPGVYYIEGYSHVVGRWGEEADVYFRSNTFTVGS